MLTTGLAVKHRVFGESPLLGRVLVVIHHHHGSVNTSTTNAPIKNRAKGGDSLRCNISTATLKILIGFASLAVKSSLPESQAINRMGWFLSFEVLRFCVREGVGYLFCCWWCQYSIQTRENLFKNCPQWRNQQKTFWTTVLKEARKLPSHTGQGPYQHRGAARRRVVQSGGTPVFRDYRRQAHR